MRTTKDLIAELRAEAATAAMVMLAVGFPSESKMVRSDQSDADALKELNGLCQRGGTPLGYIRLEHRQGNSQAVKSKVLAEWEDEEVPGQVLRDITLRMADDLERQHGLYFRLGPPPEGGEAQ